MSNENLIAEAREWKLCGACDVGMAMGCTCPPGDPRSMIHRLCDALETCRRDTLDEARGTVEAVDIDPDCDCEVVTLRAVTEALREMAGDQ